MTFVSIRRSVSLLAVALAGMLPAPAQNGVGFPMAGVAAGQTARLNALNGALPGASNSSSCNVKLQFVDASGTVLKQVTVSLAAGTATSLDLSWGDLSGYTLRAQIRAMLYFGYSGGANPPPGVLQQSACGTLVPSLEVFDSSTGRTGFILTEAKALPVVPAQ